MALATFSETTASGGYYLGSNSDNWSGGSGTGGAPAEGDTVLIPNGTTCTWDLDLINDVGFTNGLSVITIEGGGHIQVPNDLPTGDYSILLNTTGFICGSATAPGVAGFKVGTSLDNGLPIDRTFKIQKNAGTVANDSIIFQQYDLDGTAAWLDVEIYDYYGWIQRHALIFQREAGTSTDTVELSTTLTALDDAIDNAHDDLTCVVQGNVRRKNWSNATAHGTAVSGKKKYTVDESFSAFVSNMDLEDNDEGSAAFAFLGSNVQMIGPNTLNSTNYFTNSLVSSVLCCAIKGFDGAFESDTGTGTQHRHNNTVYGPVYQCQRLYTNGTSDRFLGIFVGSGTTGATDLASDNTNSAGITVGNTFKNHVIGGHATKSGSLGVEQICSAPTASTGGQLYISGLHVIRELFSGDAGGVAELTIRNATIVGDQDNTSVMENYEVYMENVTFISCDPFCDGVAGVGDKTAFRIYKDITFINMRANDSEFPTANLSGTNYGEIWRNVTFSDASSYDYYQNNGYDAATPNGNLVATATSGLPVGFSAASAEKFLFASGFVPEARIERVFAEAGATIIASAEIYLEDAMTELPPRIEIERVDNRNTYHVRAYSARGGNNDTVLSSSSTVTTTGSSQTVSTTYNVVEAGEYEVRVIMQPAIDGTFYGVGNEKIGWVALTATTSSGGGAPTIIQNDGIIIQ